MVFTIHIRSEKRTAERTEEKKRIIAAYSVCQAILCNVYFDSDEPWGNGTDDDVRSGNLFFPTPGQKVLLTLKVIDESASILISFLIFSNELVIGNCVVHVNIAAYNDPSIHRSIDPSLLSIFCWFSKYASLTTWRRSLSARSSGSNQFFFFLAFQFSPYPKSIMCRRMIQQGMEYTSCYLARAGLFKRGVLCSYSTTHFCSNSYMYVRNTD